MQAEFSREDSTTAQSFATLTVITEITASDTKQLMIEQCGACRRTNSRSPRGRTREMKADVEQ